VDNQVQVAIYAGTRVSKYETRPAAPDWLGEDQWNVFESHLLDAGAADAELDAGSDDAVPAASDARAEDYAPKYVDRQAFVTDHELVAHFPELLTIAGVLTRVTMVATVTQGELGWELGDGTFAGRIHVNSLLAVVRNENEDDGGAPICIGAPSYELRKKRLCAIADVSFEGYDDPSAACNAASWAWKFDAAPALLGRVAPLSLIPPSPCPRATDPENDRCAND
jgi:hypothetical protein